VTPEEAKAVLENSFGSWKAAGLKPDVTLPALPVNPVASVNVPDPSASQG
jgi:zinc protease